MPSPQRLSLRASALLSTGALALHELRYRIGWGGGAEHELADQVHAYLTYAMPVAAGLVAAGLAQILLRLGGTRSRTPASRHGGPTLWLGASCALLAIFVAQESAEGMLGSGHAGGLLGLFGHGGLVAIPLALAIGALIALAERGARAVLTARARLGPAVSGARWPAPDGSYLPAALHPGRTACELALHLCGRAPPAARR